MKRNAVLFKITAAGLAGALAVTLLTVFVPAGTSADTIRTKKGDVIEGDIVSQDGRYVTIRIPRSEIASIEEEGETAAPGPSAPPSGRVIVTTRNGQKQVGVITQENDRYLVLKKERGTVTVFKNMVADIDRDPAEATIRKVTREYLKTNAPRTTGGTASGAGGVYFPFPAKLGGKKLPVLYKGLAKKAQLPADRYAEGQCFSCQSGDDLICYLLAQKIYDASRSEALSRKDRERYRDYGLAMMEQACNRGIGVACRFIGNEIEANLDTEPYGDLKRAYVFYEKGCTAKSPSGEACGIIAYAYSYNDPDFLSSTGLAYRPDLQVKYLDRGCRHAAELTANQGKRCCEQLVSIYENGTGEITADAGKAASYTEAAAESDRRYDAIVRAYNSRPDVEKIAGDKGEDRKDEIRIKVADMTDGATGGNDGPADTYTAPAPEVPSFDAFYNSPGYDCFECMECKESRLFTRYLKKARKDETNASDCAAIVLACCYLKKGLFRDNNPDYPFSEKELLDIIKHGQMATAESSPCIFTCDYRPGSSVR